MKTYKNYCDTLEISPEATAALLALPERAHISRPRTYKIKWAAAAACCALLAALAMHDGRIASPLPIEPVRPVIDEPQTSLDGFIVEENGQDPTNLFAIPYIPYPAVDDIQATSADVSRFRYPDGAFTIELSRDEICVLLGGAGQIPWTLFWGGYTVNAHAVYDGDGALCEICIYGCKGEDSFTVRLAPGALPLDCFVHESTVTEVLGVDVSAYSMSDNGRAVLYSSFMAGDLGFKTTFDTGDELLSSLFIRHACIGSLNADSLLVSDNIPAWDSAQFSTYSEALSYSQFIPYLPPESPAKGWELSGHYSYQEGSREYMSLLWMRDYDNIHIVINLPEGDPEPPRTVDISNPASYDATLYDIPWCDTVPEEYVLDFSCPTFKAEDMSLDVVRARAVPHDTGGYSHSFEVLFEDGTVVRYSFDRLTAEEIWGAISPIFE